MRYTVDAKHVLIARRIHAICGSIILVIGVIIFIVDSVVCTTVELSSFTCLVGGVVIEILVARCRVYLILWKGRNENSSHWENRISGTYSKNHFIPIVIVFDL